MPYEAQISRRTPTAFLFVIDQSGSMRDTLFESTETKMSVISKVVNRTLYDLFSMAQKGDEFYDYFKIGIIGYGGGGIVNCLEFISDSGLISSEDVSNNPKSIQEARKKISDGNGGLVEKTVKTPVWLEPSATGGTPMKQAFDLAYSWLSDWCANNPTCYPPTVMHLTDGESTGDNPKSSADKIMKLSTNDGNVVLFNCHISTKEKNSYLFPKSPNELTDAHAITLFEMSSLLQGKLFQNVKNRYPDTANGSRAFMFNADYSQIIDFFDMGTRATLSLPGADR
jgi:uncharacterized protein YegL